MVHVNPFVIDQWILRHISNASVTLHNSCVAPLTIRELEKLSEDSSIAPPIPLDLPLSYGSVLGSQRLRENIAALCSPSIAWEDVLVTQGTISANFLVLDTLCGPGDHVICQYPTYQQLFEAPRRAGADVTLWKMKAENSWMPETDELEALVKDNTKLLIINNPCNPTGATIPRSLLKKIVAFASAHNIIVFCDEVFRPLFHDLVPTDAEYPPSILDMGYQNVISTGSLSKGFSLPGIRVGWVVSPLRHVIEAAVLARDYTTIAVSQLDDSVAAFALEPSVRAKILERSFGVIKENLASLEHFIEAHKSTCSWVKPAGGSVAFVKITGKNGKPVDDDQFCQGLIAKRGTLIVPGGVTFGTDQLGEYQGYIRIAFVSEPEIMRKGLDALRKYLEEDL